MVVQPVLQLVAVAEPVDELRLERLRPQVEEVLEVGIRKTMYGEPIPVATFVAETVAAQLTVRDRQPGFSSSGRTLLEKLIVEEVERVVGNDLRGVIRAAEAKVREAVEAEGAKIIRETIERLAQKS